MKLKVSSSQHLPLDCCSQHLPPQGCHRHDVVVSDVFGLPNLPHKSSSSLNVPCVPCVLTPKFCLEIRDVFELYDFWDGRDGEVDAFKTGHMLYCLGMNPTLETVTKNGGTQKLGEKAYKLEEFLPIYSAVAKEKDTGTFADFNEAFKTFDREGQGFISAAEVRHVLTCLGEKLTDTEVDELIKATDTREDLEGNIKYEDFIQKVLKGPFGDS